MGLFRGNSLSEDHGDFDLLSALQNVEIKSLSYAAFHCLFMFPAIIALQFLRPRQSHLEVQSIASICTIAFIWTVPWDNYLVYRKVWGYGESRVFATIGYVPVEEYAFFLLQPVLTGIWLLFLLGHKTSREWPSWNFGFLGWASRAIGVIFCTAVGAWGYVQWQEGNEGMYMGLILAWAMGPVAVQWAYGAPYLLCYWDTILAAVAVPTLYLWAADSIAIKDGIWWISKEYTFGIDIPTSPDLDLSLPIEEAMFFFVTNVLCVFGITLFLTLDGPPKEKHPNGYISVQDSSHSVKEQ
eukprot:Clim_evm50s146 gene=Clim_evmTU50s146